MQNIILVKIHMKNIFIPNFRLIVDIISRLQYLRSSTAASLPERRQAGAAPVLQEWRSSSPEHLQQSTRTQPYTWLAVEPICFQTRYKK